MVDRDDLTRPWTVRSCCRPFGACFRRSHRLPQAAASLGPIHRLSCQHEGPAVQSVGGVSCPRRSQLGHTALFGLLSPLVTWEARLQILKLSTLDLAYIATIYGVPEADAQTILLHRLFSIIRTCAQDSVRLTPICTLLSESAAELAKASWVSDQHG